MSVFSTRGTDEAFEWLLESDLITYAFTMKTCEEFVDKVEPLIPHDSILDELYIRWDEIFNAISEYRDFCIEFSNFSGDIDDWYKWKRGDFDPDYGDYENDCA